MPEKHSAAFVQSIPPGRHMAPLARPQIVNPIVRGFLDAAAPQENKVPEVHLGAAVHFAVC